MGKETIVIIFIGVLIWLLCGVLFYFVIREVNANEGLGWYVSDRIGGLLFGLLGPLALAAAIMLYLTSIGEDTPAKW